ncbi:MAG: response regulator transcription factor [Desulfobacteraceae bacterium]|jgi:two-component system response regulator CpxR
MVDEKILIVDDDMELCTLLEEYLTGEGFQLETCHDGNLGYEQAMSHTYALVILDVMLPGCNGFDVLKKIRKTSEVPVLMLTARSDEVDRIVGLEIGADDYLAKPFNPRELLARIRAIFRRTQTTSEEKPATDGQSRISVGDVVLELTTRRARLHNKEIALTTVEFNLLRQLMESAGQIVSREKLNTAVLGREYSPLDRSIDVHISNLRKKLGPLEGNADRIKAIRGEGYLYAFSEESERKQ